MSEKDLTAELDERYPKERLTNPVYAGNLWSISEEVDEEDEDTPGWEEDELDEEGEEFEGFIIE